MRNLAGMRRWASSLTAGPPQVQPCCIRHPRPATHHHSASITTHHSFNQRPSSSLRSFSNLAPHSTSFSSPHAPAVSFSQAPTSPHVVPSTPFAFALLYRYPPHYAAEDDPTYLNKPFQFLLKLAQPQHSSLPPSSFSSSSAPLYHVHELTFFADLTTHDLERALVTHFPTLTSVQLVHNGQPLPPSTPIQSMFNKRKLGFLIHSSTTPPYSLSINGGLPLSPGVESLFSRYRWVHLSAVFMLIAVVMLSMEDKPSREDDGEGDAAHRYWAERMKEGKDKFLEAVTKK